MPALTYDLVKLLETIFPKERVKSRLIDLVAYASDAGFYHLQPKAVVLPVSEQEIQSLFRFSHDYNIPITFRAAGTSLSGQSITDGILVDLSRYWKDMQVENGGDTVRIQPGVIGAVVNARLKKYARKIGPDPASINSAMMGGILSNNASGMCCGVSRNSYHTTKYIRFILPSGQIFSTENIEDYKRFKVECPEVFEKLTNLRNVIISNPALFDKIRGKYQTKNTVGYSINAFIDYEDPLDILAHLLIGGEGTLGFISEVVMETLPDYPEKSTALLYFPDIYAACRAIVPLTLSGAEAVELMDRASLRSVEHIKGVPDLLKFLPESAAALLVEYQDHSQDALQLKAERFIALSHDLSLLHQPVFTSDPIAQAFLWKIRKGMFPAVGAVRNSGTTVILEDIAFPVERLGDAILDLQQLFKSHGYDHAIIFGHAKDGNIHFVVTQDLNIKFEIDRYNAFMQDVVKLVVDKYDGALKAEHGTGRNMAPFVETEWGSELYEIMKEIKQSIDPYNLLNPGVIINEDKNAHIHHLKQLPQVEQEVDKCMDCGFCEHKCPSRNVTLTPRRRIVVRRELKRLQNAGNKVQYKQLLHQYQYDGLDTCAVDGLCATACPVEINTGDLVKRLRKENHSAFSNKLSLIIARNFGLVVSIINGGLKLAVTVNRLAGKNTLLNLSKGIKKILPGFPIWSNQLHPTPDYKRLFSQNPIDNEYVIDHHKSVIYFPSCISRCMGGSAEEKKSLVEVFIGVSAKAGIKISIPHQIASYCCGQLYSSKGFTEAYTNTINNTIEQIWHWTESGKLPIVVDATSCTYTLHHCRSSLTEENKYRFDQLTIIDTIDYIAEFILPAVHIKKKKAQIVLHPVCSLQKMGLEGKFISIAQALADRVETPLYAGCCGMAGDRGFWYPELTSAATKFEAEEVKQFQYEGYYSSAKTCEMNLSDAVGKNYESIMYLLDECI